MATQGRLNVTIGADTTQLTAGIQKAMGSLRGLLSLGALTALARQAIAYGSAINDAATRSGVGVKWLQATAYAAKMAGSSLEELSTALVELRRAQAQALSGSASDQGAFGTLGISIRELRDLAPEALFDRIAESVRKTNGGLAETNAALQVLGRGGRGLLAGMVDGFSESREEAERLGLVLDESVITAMDELGDRLDTLKLGFTALTAVVLKNMMSLNNWAHLIRLVQEARNTFDGVRIGAAFLKGGTAGVVAHFASQADAMSSIVDSYSAAEDASDSAAAARMARRGARSSTVTNLDAKDRGSRGERIQLDRLARLGMFAGGGAGEAGGLIRIQTQALGQLREMKAYLRRLADRNPYQSIDW